MTPLQAAKTHCANYQQESSCLGIYYNDDLSVDRSRYRPCEKCLLAEGKRCEYFEEIIVPMRMSRETAEAKARADKKEAAVSAYLKLHKLIPSRAELKRMCLQCRKVEVEGIARFCDKCARKRKLISTRESKWSKRGLNGRKTGNSRIGAEALTKPDLKGGYSSSGHSHFGIVAPTREGALSDLQLP